MKYCYHCGGELFADAVFCPHCGKSLRPQYAPPAQTVQAVRPAEPVKPRVDGGVLGRSIAATVLGASGLFMGLYAVIFLMLDGLMLDMGELTGLLVMLLYTGIFSVIGLAYGIPGLILGKHAQQRRPGFKLATVGKILSLVCVIIGGALLMIAFVLFVATLRLW